MKTAVFIAAAIGALSIAPLANALQALVVAVEPETGPSQEAITEMVRRLSEAGLQAGASAPPKETLNIVRPAAACEREGMSVAETPKQPQLQARPLGEMPPGKAIYAVQYSVRGCDMIVPVNGEPYPSGGAPRTEEIVPAR